MLKKLVNFGHKLTLDCVSLLGYKPHINPSIAVLKAVLVLKSPELAPFTGWLRQELGVTLELLTTAPESNLQVLQGKAQVLASILNLIETAPAVLNKLEGRKP